MSRDDPSALPPAPAPAPGAAERHIARGTLVQQVATASGIVVMLAVVTVLGRSLTLSEFGLYGLSLSIASYVLFVQGSVEGAAVRAIAGAPDGAERAALFSTAIVVYTGLGLLAGLLVAVVGVGLTGVLGIPEDLRAEAREAFVVLGLLTAVGWPLKGCHDALRATQRFGLAALGEVLAYIAFGVAMVLLLVIDAPLWALIGVGGAMPALIGLVCLFALVLAGVGPHLNVRLVDGARARDMLRVSTGLMIGGAADLFIYSTDRVVLAAFRSAATVGLYEGAVRAHNLLRQVHGTLVLTVTPVTSGYLAAGDHERIRELLLRGTRYVLAVVVPGTVVLMVLAQPILEVWLGPKFRPAGLALAILCSYWLIGASTGVAGSMLIAAGKISELAKYAWLVAISNLCLSLILTPIFGLEGVVLGTTIPYVLTFPIFLRIVLTTFPQVSVGDLLREAWGPAYACALGLATGLLAVRLLADLDTVAEVAGAGTAGLALYWVAYYAIWLRPNERVLVRSFLRRRVAAP